MLYTCVTELTFKRHVMSPAAGTAERRFFVIKEKFMNILVYTDESGVFDKRHNSIYVFGGLVFLNRQTKELCSRKYIAAEKCLRGNKYSSEDELKACRITNKEKSKLFRSLNQYIKFGVVIKQNYIMDRIFDSKKDKQRYLDYAYKIGLKRCFEKLIAEGSISVNDVENIYIYVDEHTTATNGRYELKEGLEQEFKNGTYNYQYDKYFPPLFSQMKGISLEFCNSEQRTLIRAADIVANKIYSASMRNELDNLKNKITITYLP